MVDNEDTRVKGGETCDAIEGGYSIFLDGETVQSFMESEDFSSARELDNFKEVESQVEKWLKEGEGVSLLALSFEENRLSRDFSVLQIAHLMAKHGKTVLIVDCDFLHPGLSGLVEHVEDHGFLDFLLYGSSLQSISRATGIDGVNVVGPGSFPVSRTIPFAIGEFEKVKTFLNKRSDAVIYCSTLYTDDGAINPLCTEGDGIILCCRIEEMKEGQLQSSLSDLGSAVPPVDLICFCDRKEAGEVAPVPALSGAGESTGAVERATEGEAAQSSEGGGAPVEEKAAAYIEKTEEIEARDEDGGSRLNIPRIVTIAVGVIIIGFIAWWVIIDRSIRGKGDANKRTELVQKQRDIRDRAGVESGDRAGIESGGEQGATPLPVDTTGAEISPPVSSAPVEQPASDERAAEEKSDTASGEASAGEPPLMEGISEGRYAIHVASFKDIARAGREKEYFEKKGYTVSILVKDINGEEWFRICVGGYATREEAVRVKAELMDLPNVGYARVIELKERM